MEKFPFRCARFISTATNPVPLYGNFFQRNGNGFHWNQNFCGGTGIFLPQRDGFRWKEIVSSRCGNFHRNLGAQEGRRWPRRAALIRFGANTPKLPSAWKQVGRWLRFRGERLRFACSSRPLAERGSGGSNGTLTLGGETRALRAPGEIQSAVLL